MAPRIQLLLSIIISGGFETILANEGSNRIIAHLPSRIGDLETLRKSNSGDTSSLNSPTHKPGESVDPQLLTNIPEVPSTQQSIIIVIASKRRNRNRNLHHERRHRSWSVLHQHYHYHHHHHHHGNNSEENKTNNEKSKPNTGHVLRVSGRPEDHSVSKFNDIKIKSVNHTLESSAVPGTTNQKGNDSSRIGVLHHRTNFANNVNYRKRNYENHSSASTGESSDESTSEKSDEYRGKETEKTGSDSTVGPLIRTKRYKPHSESNNFNDSKRAPENHPTGSERIPYHGSNSEQRKENSDIVTGRTGSNIFVENLNRTMQETSKFIRNLNDSKRHSENTTIESGEAAYHGSRSAIDEQYPGRTDPTDFNSTAGSLFRTKCRRPFFRTMFNDSERQPEVLKRESIKLSSRRSHHTIGNEYPRTVSDHIESNITEGIVLRSTIHGSNINGSKRHSENTQIKSGEVAYNGSRSAIGEQYPRKLTDPTDFNSTAESLVRTKCRRTFFRTTFNDTERQSEALKRESIELSSRGSQHPMDNVYPRTISDQIKSNITEGIILPSTMHGSNINDSKRHSENTTLEPAEVVYYGKRSAKGKERLGKENDQTGSNPTGENLVRNVHQRSHIRSSFNDSKWQTPASEEESFHGSHTAIGNEYPRKISDQIERISMKTNHGESLIKSGSNDRRKRDDEPSPDPDDISLQDGRSIISKEYTGSNSTEGSLIRNKRARPGTMINIRYNDSSSRGSSKEKSGEHGKSGRRKQKSRLEIDESSGSDESKPRRRSHHSSW